MLKTIPTAESPSANAIAAIVRNTVDNTSLAAIRQKIPL
jgi:hypothetical protein